MLDPDSPPAKRSKVTPESGLMRRLPLPPAKRSKLPVAHAVWSKEPVTRHGDAEVARVAERQRGVIDMEQLRAAGLTRHAVAHRRCIGLLHPLYRSVFLWGRPRLQPLAAETAAVLHLAGCGVLGGATSLWLWDAVDERPDAINLTVCGRRPEVVKGLRVHRVAELPEEHLRLHKGLPTTSPARAIVELAATADTVVLESALTLVRDRRLACTDEIREMLRRCPKAAGTRRLRRLLEARPGELHDTRSRYERKLLKLIRQANLPPPLTNVLVDGDRVDMYWPDHRLILKFDGFAYHADRRSFRQDRARDRRHAASGHHTIRVVSDDVDRTPFAVIAWVAEAIGQARAQSLKAV